MTVYVDHARRTFGFAEPRSHMAADSLEELHQFAAMIQVAGCWFHASKRHPHYDVTDAQREYAIRCGAVPVRQRELLEKSKAMRRK